MSDARSLARELLNRVGPGSRPATPTAARTSTARRPGVQRVEDLPQVRESLDRDAQMVEAEVALEARAPFYRPHRGINGATIDLDGEHLINFSSYNYLGLAGHPRMREASQAAIAEYGTTSGATRIVSGNIPLHEELEAEIAAAYGTEAATTVGSGFLTNASVIAFVLGEKDLAVCDELVHNSIVAGTLWSHARRMQFRHNDPESLDQLLRRSRNHFENVLVILEGVYSMDGDICALPEMIEVARRHGCLVMIDEAHSFGVLGERGRGAREHFHLPADAVDIWMGTLSKALASHGGYVTGSHEFVQACRMSASGMSLFAAGLTPADAAAALTAIRLVADEPERLVRLHANADLMVQLLRDSGIDVGPSGGTSIVPAILGAGDVALVTAMMLAKEGINANPIAYPAVPEGEARIRFFVSADHTEEQLRYTVDTLAPLKDEVVELMALRNRGTLSS